MGCLVPSSNFNAINCYQTQTAFGSAIELAVGIHRREQDRSKSEFYELSVVTIISGVAFETRFGKQPAGGYIGEQNLGDLLNLAAIDVPPSVLNEYFQRWTPNLEADFLTATNEIQIKRIERHAISPGQRFCERTLRQLLDITPTATSVYFDWILNSRTRELILPVLVGEKQVSSLADPAHRSALVSALISNGFRRLIIIRQGPADFGIRAFQDEELSWSIGSV